MITNAQRPATVGLMFSGGIDSAILLASLLRAGERVQPFYVATGSAWQLEERRAVEQFITALGHPGVAPVVDLLMPVHDLYGSHWSMTGQEVPDSTTPDEAVALPGRNPLLLLKPVLWCGQNGIRSLAVATLAGNPFDDATPQFARQFERTLSQATGKSVEIVQPFAFWSKAEVLADAADLPLQLTFSCLAPRDDGQPRHIQTHHIQPRHIQPRHIQPRHIQPRHIQPGRMQQGELPPGVVQQGKVPRGEFQNGKSHRDDEGQAKSQHPDPTHVGLRQEGVRRLGVHCGVCNKCAERSEVLQALPGGDPTIYASFDGAAANS